MKNGRLKNSVAFLLLALFLLGKMAGLHVFSHTDEENHAVDCAICIHINTNNLTPAISPDYQDFTIKNTEPLVQGEIIENYNFIISSSIDTDQLFSRPPPFLL